MESLIRNNQSVIPTLIPVTRWREYFADPSTGALRWMIFKNQDGFRDKCVITRGRRLLVDTAAYDSWLREQQGK